MAGDHAKPGPAPIRTESFAEASRLLRTAALARVIDEPGSVRLTPLLQGRLALRPHTVDLAADAAVREAAHTLLTHGWTPAELHTFAERRLDPAARSYLVDTLAATAQWSAGVPWFADLAKIRARVWWTAGLPHLGQWATRHGHRRYDAIRIAVEVLALLSYLPCTDRPQPDMPAPPAIAPDALVQDAKIIGRIDALLARANASDYPEEALACAAKAQELMVRYASTPAPRAGSVTADTVAAALRRLCTENPLVLARTLLARARRLAARPSPTGELEASPHRPLPLAQITRV
jgi:hypothetical protein